MAEESQEATVSTRVDAPAEKVYELVSDLTRMGEWSPECVKVEWQGGARRPEPGAVFKGHNQNGARKWSTKGTIVAVEPGRSLSYDISSVFNLPVARWTYRIEPSGDAACTLSETWQDRRGRLMDVLGRLATGVKERKGHNTDGMRQTLERIKAAAERS